LRRFNGLWLIAALLWTGVIFVFSSQPYSEQEAPRYIGRQVSDSAIGRHLPDVAISYNGKTYSPDAGSPQWVEFVIRKGAHLFEYGLLAVLWRLALSRRDVPWRRVILTMLIVIATAAADEWNQSFVPGRTALAADVVLDAIGGMLGLAFFSIIVKIQNVLTCYRSYHKMSTNEGGDMQ